MVNNSNKKKPVRKRQVTAKIAATKYEIVSSSVQVIQVVQWKGSNK